MKSTYRHKSPNESVDRIKDFPAWLKRQMGTCIMFIRFRAYRDGYDDIIITAVTFECKQWDLQFMVEAEPV